MAARYDIQYFRGFTLLQPRDIGAQTVVPGAGVVDVVARFGRRRVHAAEISEMSTVPSHTVHTVDTHFALGPHLVLHATNNTLTNAVRGRAGLAWAPGRVRAVLASQTLVITGRDTVVYSATLPPGQHAAIAVDVVGAPMVADPRRARRRCRCSVM